MQTTARTRDCQHFSQSGGWGCAPPPPGVWGVVVWGFRRCPTLPEGFPSSTIGAGRLNFRVRDGYGCVSAAVATGKFCVAHWCWCCCGGFMVSTSWVWFGFSSPRPISTGKLSTLLCVHFRPIYVVVFHGPYPHVWGGRSHLGTGFALRCFQRLSFPQVASQRCPWRDNWYTRAASIPVLSY